MTLSAARGVLLPQARKSSRAPSSGPQAKQGFCQMLHYAVVFLVIALIAAFLGFGGIAAGAVEIAKLLFFVFVVMAIVALVISIVRKR